MFGTDWPSKTKQKFAHMITLMPKQLKQTWDMMFPRCIYIALGKTCPLATFTDGGRSAILGWKKACPQSQVALDWLNYVSTTEHIFIQHAGNSARGKKSEERKYPRMDFMPLQTQSEFDECLFHACSCILDCKSDDAKKQELAVKAERTQRKHAYIRQLGYNLVVMKECQRRPIKRAK